MDYLIGCRALSEIVAKYIPDKTAKLIDIAAGSGYLGTQVIIHNILSAGFTLSLNNKKKWEKIPKYMFLDGFGKFLTFFVHFITFVK